MDTLKDSSPHLSPVRTFQKDAQHAENTIDGVTLTVPPTEQRVSTDTLLSDIGHQGRTRNMAKKVSFDVERAFNNEMVQEGTIVTDRKQARLGIATLFKLAITEWWKKTQHSVKDTVQKIESSSLFVEKNTATVAAPETRTEVIEKASQHTQHIPHDDHAHVVEKVRSYAQSGAEEHGPTLVVKASTQLQTPSWGKEPTIPSIPPEKITVPKPPTPETYEKSTSVISPLRPLSAFTPKALGETVPPRVSVVPPTLDLRGKPLSSTASKKENVPSKPHLPIGSWSHFTDSTDTPHNTQKTVSANTFAPSPQREVVEKYVPPPRPVTVPLPRTPLPSSLSHSPPLPARQPLPPVKIEEEIRQQPTRTETKPVDNEKTLKNEEPIQSSHEKASLLDHIPRSLMLLGIVLLGVTFGVMAAFSRVEKMDTERTPETISPKEGAKHLLTTDETIDLTLQDSREETMTALSQTVNGSASMSVALTIFLRTESGLEPATVERVLQHIAPHAPAAFIRSLEQSYAIGGIRTTSQVPYIVLTSQNFDTAFAGMLTWERSMSHDLAPFFGEEVKETLAPRTTESSPTTPYFVDEVRDGAPTRVLYDALGNERIVYTLLQDGHIFITTSTDALGGLISRVR